MKLMNWFLCCFAIGFVLVLPGCGKKNAEVPPKNPALAQEESNTAADLEMLDKTLREYVSLKKAIPKDLNELVTSGFVRSLPAPPPGKKFAIRNIPMGYQVVLVNQ